MSNYAASIWQADAFYDADEQGGAGNILYAVHDCMVRLVPNQTLEVRASNPEVVAELAAWCRLTGHVLIMQGGDRHLIRHK